VTVALPLSTLGALPPPLAVRLVRNDLVATLMSLAGLDVTLWSPAEIVVHPFSPHHRRRQSRLGAVSCIVVMATINPGPRQQDDDHPMATRNQLPDRRPGSTPESAALALEQNLAFRLGRAHRAVRGAWEARIADLRLSSPQASVLRAVVEQPGIGIRELARRLRTDPMNVKRLADGLEAAGLLASVTDRDDRRRRVLRLTDAGMAVRGELEVRAIAWDATLEGILGRADAARLSATLTRIEDGITALADAGPNHEETDRG
jgi:DNA-binding MarR family transcriptional regulator